MTRTIAVALDGDDEIDARASCSAASALVIDSQRHELRDGSYLVSLSSRLVLRRLLYAFAMAPGGRLSRDGIAETLWNASYHPMRHASSVKSSIHRLRLLLDGTRAVLQTELEGYRLVLPKGAILVTPRARQVQFQELE